MKKAVIIFSVLLTLLLTGCTSAKTLRERIDAATNEYKTGIVTDIKNYIENCTYSDLINDCEITTTIEHDGGINQVLNVCIYIDDIYDGYSFPEQYDLAFDLFSKIQDEFNAIQSEYELFSYWVYNNDHKNEYCKAFNLPSGYHISTNTYLEYCIKTTTNTYECSQTMGSEYFCINGKEYYDTFFKQAYGTATNYDLLTRKDKQEIRNYIQSRYDYYEDLHGGDTGDKYSDKIWAEVSEKWGITETQVTMIWANLD